MATFKILTKANEEVRLTIRDGMVVLADSDSEDTNQLWIKDETFSRVKELDGTASFALVNAATNLAIKHSITKGFPVQLVPYTTEYLNEEVLWTAKDKINDEFGAIRMFSNTTLTLDAFIGGSGPVQDGTILGLWNWHNGNNQRWKLVPFVKL